MFNLSLPLKWTMRQIHEIPLPSLIISSVLSTLLLLCFLRKWKLSSKINLPPSPQKLPILGNFHQLSLLPHKDLRSLAEKHGPLMLVHYGSKPAIIASSADMAREIMKTHDQAFSDRFQPSVCKRLSYGCKEVAFASYGEYWRQLKSIIVLQLLSNKRVQSFHSIRVEETAVLMDNIRGSEHSSVNMSDMFTDMTTDIICRSAFGKKYREGEIGSGFIALMRECLNLMASFSVGDFIPWLWWINRVNGFDARVDKVSKELDDFLECAIRERMDMEDGRGENFLDILLDIYQNNTVTSDVYIDKDSIKAVILDIFIAGPDTTSAVLEWAMSELLRQPRIMSKLQDEVREIVEDGREITDADLEKMHFLNAVIKETLRCHTPLPLLIPRVAREDVKIKGYDISRGMIVMVNAWAISRDPSVWDEPEEFRPERFLNSSMDFRGLDFEFTPFGTGRRACPGVTFSMSTIKYVLANIVHKFDWELPFGADGKDLDMSDHVVGAVHRVAPLHAVAIKCYN